MDQETRMAWIVNIDNVEKHPNADALDICTVGGWKCVTKLGDFKKDDLAVYLRIDSWCPTTLAPFLSKGKEPREFNGVKGERLRTVKLRGELSQGLLLPVTIGIGGFPFIKSVSGEIVVVNEGDDVTEALGIQKWERPIPACLAGMVKGNWPSVVQKTDEERCLSEDTAVITDLGVKTIKEIVDHELQCKVLSVNHATNEAEFKRVVGFSSMTRKQCWLRVLTKSGKSLIVTKNHKVWLDDLQCYRSAEELAIGDKLKIYHQD